MPRFSLGQIFKRRPSSSPTNYSVRLAVGIAVLTLLWVGSSFFKTPEHPCAVDEVVVNGACVQKEGADTADTVIPDARVRSLKAEAYKNEIRLTGRTFGFQKTDLRAEVAGRVDSLLIEEGRFVTKDTPLLQIQDNDRSARVSEAEQKLKQAEIEYRASQALTQKGYNSEVRLATAKAELEAAKARLVQATIDRDNLIIKAPYDGIFERRHVDVGDYVQVADLMATMVDLDPLKIVGFVTEQQVGEIKVGDPATVTLLDGRVLDAKLTFIASVAGEQTRTFQIEMQVENPEQTIQEGLTARMMIKGKHHDAYFISPSSLSLADDGTVGVKTVDEKNTVRFNPVRILQDTKNGMWVDGLPASIRLITVGQDFVTEGQTVNPVEQSSKGLL